MAHESRPIPDKPWMPVRDGAPTPTIGWYVGFGGVDKVCRTKRVAYYTIAKRLIVQKYPSWLTSATIDPYEYGEQEGWPRDLVTSRRSRRELMFYDDRYQIGIEEAFDMKRWRRFVSRVARFLMFVDERRGLAAEVDEWTDETLNAELELAENRANFFMSRAAALLVEQNRRRSAT